MAYTKESRDRLARVIELQKAGRMRSFELPPGRYVETTATDLERNVARLAAIDHYLAYRARFL